MRASASNTTGTSAAACWDSTSRSRDNSIESIYDICEAVDWIEREMHEGFNIDFTGREYEPLLLREGECLRSEPA